MFEACDDGIDTSAVRFNGKGEGSCVGDCTSVQQCGDGTASGTEVCDDGTNNGNGDTYCINNCSALQDCGDRVINGTEECDNATTYCTSECISLIHTGDVIIKSQTDFNAISGKRKIDGNMTVTQLWIQQITLNDIYEVTGDLTISHTNELTRVEFPELIRVHGSLYIGPEYTMSGDSTIANRNDNLTHVIFPHLGKIDGALEIRNNPLLEKSSFNFDGASDIGGNVAVKDNPQYCPSLWLKIHFYDSDTKNFYNNRSENDPDGCYPPTPTPTPIP
jgi:hypothetical protein